MTKYYLLENREIFFPTNTYTIEVTDKKFLKTIKKLKKDLRFLKRYFIIYLIVNGINNK